MSEVLSFVNDKFSSIFHQRKGAHMKNNDILRRVRYIFDFNDNMMIEIFSLADFKVSRELLSNWLKKEEDEEFVILEDVELAIFLNGLIVKNRGAKEGKRPIPEEILNNNTILRKLKIALELKDVDLLEILKVAGRELSKHELSALFRKPGHKNYRNCNDQILRNFLMGLQLKYRS